MSVATLEEIPTLFAKYKVAEKVLSRISIWNGDITKLEVDAIVNAANSRLAGGGGVDAAIHRAAGYTALQAECREYDGCPVGEAVITSGCGITHIKNIIHTVGPQIYGKLKPENEKDLLSCYKKSLELAEENNLRSIAFCCISTGVYGYPNGKAADSVSKFLVDYLENNNTLVRVVLVTFLDVDNAAYNNFFEDYASSMKNNE